MRNIEFTKEWIIANKIAIQCNNKQEADDICRIFGAPTGNYSYNYCCCFGSDASFIHCTFYPYSAAISYRETIIKASDVIAEYEASKRKIIGYKAPFDLYRGSIKKDSIFKQSANYDHWFVSGIIHTIQMAPEIVTTWEPVYEEVKPCFASFDDLICYLVKKGEKFESIKFGDEIIDKSKYDFTPEFEQKLKDMGINI